MEVEKGKGGSTGDTRSSDLTDGNEAEKGKASSTGRSGSHKEKGGCSYHTTESQDLS